MELREYQKEMNKNVRHSFSNGHTRIILQSPTGSGKTVMFSYIVKQASIKNTKCLILTNRIELLKQAGGTFEKFGLDYEYISAKTKNIPTNKTIVAMVETIKRRAKNRLDFTMWLKTIDLVIIDECHISSFDGVFPYLSDDCYVVGATATPIRKSAKNALKNHYSKIVEGVFISELVKQGFLARPKYYGVSVDLSTVKIKAGEFDENDMEKIYTQNRVFEGLKENLNRYAEGKKTMIFCPSVQTSINVAKELGCDHIDGEMNTEERSLKLKNFENTEGSIITNCAITTTGYDHAQIECVVLYRATTSLPLYLQMCGRGSRVTERKDSFIILDFGMNIQRHGFWHSDRKWSLEPPKKKNRNKKDVFPVKFCPKCSAVLSAQAKQCTECEYIYPVKEEERIFVELQEMSYEQIQDKMKNAKTVEEMEQIRVSKNYKMGFVLHKFKRKEQFFEYAELKGYKKGWANFQIKRFLN